MNGRAVFRKFAQYKGKEAVSFVRVDPDYYELYKLITKDSNGVEEHTAFTYKEMTHFTIRNY